MTEAERCRKLAETDRRLATEAELEMVRQPPALRLGLAGARRHVRADRVEVAERGRGGVRSGSTASAAVLYIVIR